MSTKLPHFHRNRLKTYILPFTIAVLVIAARLIPGPRTIDDAYITFRYARNILAGNGFVYNPGEHVLGTTTPLYTILLSFIGLFTGGVDAPFPLIGMGINTLADVFTCLLLLYLGRRFGSPLAGLGAALTWIIHPFSVTFAIGGMETSLFVLLLTATVTAHIQGRHTAAAVLGAASLLTRPDALILIGPLAVSRFLQIITGTDGAGKLLSQLRTRLKQQRPILFNQRLSIVSSTFIRPIEQTVETHNWRSLRKELIGFGLPVFVWVVFSTIYFGSPITHSISAKTVAYQLQPLDVLVRLVQHFSAPFMDDQTMGIPWIGVGMVLYPFLYLLGTVQGLRASRRAWPYFVYPLLYFAAFAIAHPPIFRWYLTPPLPVYILGIMMGTERIFRDIFRTRLDSPDMARARLTSARRLGFSVVGVFFIIIAPFLLSFGDWTRHPDHGLSRPAPEMSWYKLELLYHQAAEYLAPLMDAYPNQPPVLAAGDVGVLGFRTPSYILDTVGLNSPQTPGYYPLDPSLYVTNYAVPPDLIADFNPDYIVLMEVYIRNGLLKDSRFRQEYELIKKIPTDIYTSDGMLIFARK